LRILVVGNGGREHALAWRLAQDPGVTVRVAPGNALVEDVATLVPVELTDIAGLVTAATTWPADLVVVGPEAVLAAGLSDALAAAGITVLGPSQAATRIEASKSFARELMEACRIPMARGESFDDPAAAIRHVEAAPGPVVIKADGLAKGKGVVLPANRREAARVIERFMVEEVLGAAGRMVVIEEALTGRELSFQVLADGHAIVPLPVARDFKRLRAGDQGPNTGGMGAVSAPGLLSDPERCAIGATIIRPLLDLLERRGMPYCGVLYAGLMMTPDGPKVLEFNVRPGDPETQCVVSRIEGNMSDVLWRCAKGELEKATLQEASHATVCVVLAARGYPDHPMTGDEVTGIREAMHAPGTQVFGAGIARRDGGMHVTAGGRVLSVVAQAEDIPTARDRAYAAADQIRFDGQQRREDIAVQ